MTCPSSNNQVSVDNWVDVVTEEKEKNKNPLSCVSERYSAIPRSGGMLTDD